MSLQGFYCQQPGCNNFATVGVAKRMWVRKYYDENLNAEKSLITCRSCAAKLKLQLDTVTGNIILPLKEKENE
jgi:hypothetical protein